MTNPFDFVNSINFNKHDLMTGTENDELAEKSYVPFLTNRSLSYFTDTILYANNWCQCTLSPCCTPLAAVGSTSRAGPQTAAWVFATKSTSPPVWSAWWWVTKIMSSCNCGCCCNQANTGALSPGSTTSAWWSSCNNQM